MRSKVIQFDPSFVSRRQEALPILEKIAERENPHRLSIRCVLHTPRASHLPSEPYIIIREQGIASFSPYQQTERDNEAKFNKTQRETADRYGLANTSSFRIYVSYAMPNEAKHMPFLTAAHTYAMQRGFLYKGQLLRETIQLPTLNEIIAVEQLSPI